MTQPIVLYGLESRTGQTYSPNVWKARLTLDYKRLPYTIVRVEIPDVESTLKEIGAPPSGVRENGSPLYTVPTIYDPNTGKAIFESGKIARYLDGQYPASPRLIPEGTSALHVAFDTAFMILLMPIGLLLLIAPDGVRDVNPATGDVLRSQFEARTGMATEHFTVPEVRERCWRNVEGAFRQINGWLTFDGTNPPFFTGEQTSYADITVAAFVLGAKLVFGEESPRTALD